MKWANVSMTAAGGVLLLGGIGCQAAYRTDSKKLDSLWTNGNYEEAAHVAYRDAREESPYRKNRVVYFLEAGRAAQAAGDYKSSVEAFDHAFVDTFPYLNEAPEATVSEAIVTTVGNDTMSIYRGTPNDRIMLHTFNALNFMAMGDMSMARIELNRAMLWQDDAHHRYARAIELATQRNADSLDDAAGKWSDDNDSGWSSDSAGIMHGNTSSIMAQHYDDLPDKAAYANYGNPFASHLDGIFRLAVRNYGGDLPAARTGLRQVASMMPSLVPVVGDDIVHASTQDGVSEPTTWIYFMTGQTPDKEEVRISMPLALSGGFTMPTLALPKLVANTDMVPWLDVRTDEAGSSRSHLLSDTADVARWQFKERLPMIISQEAIRATGKAVAAYAATRFASEQQSLAASLLALGTVLYQVGSAQADLRCWHTLPAEIQVARIPTPASGRLYLSTPDGRDLGVAHVAADEHNILVVSMPSNASPTPSLMPIQLTGERTPWVATFDLHAVPKEVAVDDADTGEAMSATADTNTAPPSIHASPHSSMTIDVAPVLRADATEANAPRATPPPVIDPATFDGAIDHPRADVPAPHDDAPHTLEASMSPHGALPVLAFAAIDTATAPAKTPPPPPVAAPPVPNHRYPVTGVTLTWGQNMQWKPDVDRLLDSRVTLQPTPGGYTAHYGGESPLVTSPAALLKDRPVWMHQDALVAMSDTVARALSSAGYVGTRVYPALGTPNQFGHSMLHFVVFLPVDSLDATVRWPDSLAAIPHPSLPRIASDNASSLPHTTQRQRRNPLQDAPAQQPAIDIDTLDELPTTRPAAPGAPQHNKPNSLFPSGPLAGAKVAAGRTGMRTNTAPAVPRPRLPKGPQAVKAIKATWGHALDWYPDLHEMLDTPVRLRADRTGYHAHHGDGPVIVSTPGLLVARQPASMHADAMHAMGRALQGVLEDRGFIGTTVHPACTMPDARGLVELHLVVFMPMEDTSQSNILPANLAPVPLPATPKSIAPAKKAPAS